MDVYFCLRLKKNHFIEQKTDVWLELKDLGLSPGISLFLQGVKVTKTSVQHTGDRTAMKSLFCR